MRQGLSDPSPSSPARDGPARAPAISRLALPEVERVAAGVETEHVRDAGRRELPVEPDILGPETCVALADVEREQGRIAANGLPQVRDERVSARPGVGLRRAQMESLRAGRIGRMEVAAPGLDDGKGLEMVEREQEGAVPAGGEPDQGSAGPAANRPVVRVDVGRKLLGDRGLPVASGAPVQVLGVGVTVPGPLRGDHERAEAALLQRGGDESEGAEGVARGREAVEVVDDGVAAAGLVPGREVDGEAELPAQRIRMEGLLLDRAPQAEPEPELDATAPVAVPAATTSRTAAIRARTGQYCGPRVPGTCRAHLCGRTDERG